MEPTHFQIEFTNERILPSEGLTLVGAILENSGFIDRLNRQDATGRRSGRQIKNGGILSSYIGCLRMGKVDSSTARSKPIWAWNGSRPESVPVVQLSIGMATHICSCQCAETISLTDSVINIQKIRNIGRKNTPVAQK